ncbi:hypothetical protein KL86DPRO_20274 [uncultured delta proteobacterium]|uniref:Uncharacterized protein n=1 Tax=uncultured delta proteobacterium TaxID=34034 RepID=A0A212JXQ7_9DELT|nr:hypothetical protein KL86DPRO_20274 [uncultured delta proteobacterium]
MGQIMPKKYCISGQPPGESPDPCTPAGVTTDLKASPVFIVSLNGDTWLEDDSPDDAADPLGTSPNPA